MEWILLGLFAAIILWGILIFNRLVGLRQMANNGWSDIDVQLKRRADLIPQLVEMVKGLLITNGACLKRLFELIKKSLPNIWQRPKINY